jgi:hypothetical protein
MKAIVIEIIRLLSDDYPGFVECRFIDAWQKEHIIQEKIPVVSDRLLDEKCEYPVAGIVACELLRKWTDNEGRRLLKISTKKPWDIETVEGLNEFDLLEEHLIELENKTSR